MEINLPIHLQEVIFSSSDSNISRQISLLEKEGKIRKIASRIYTSNFIDSNEDIVKNSDRIIAFWDGKSKGTKNTIDLCEKYFIRYA